jgi:hypothetical protein
MLYLCPITKKKTGTKTMAQKVHGIETSNELPVESLFNEALNGFISVHAELSKLPQDPNDVLQPANTMLRDMGVDVDSDYSMLITAALGNLALDAGLESFGMASHKGLSMGMDAASSILMGISDNKQNKTCTTSFKKSAYPKVEPRSKAIAPNTMMLKQALKAKKTQLIKNTASKRKALKQQLNTHMENIKELMVFKSCGITHVHRITAQNGDTGTYETYLVAAKDKPHLALTTNGKRYERPIDLSSMPPKHHKMGLAA